MTSAAHSEPSARPSVPVSVVVPLYNKANTIVPTLWSVLNQTFKNFEVIVIDDGSTDESAALVATLRDDRIRLVAQENQGVSAARNRGIREARAPLVAFLDADDFWYPGYLEAILALYAKFPAAGIFATGHRQSISPRLAVDTVFKLPGNARVGLTSDYLAGLAEGGFIWPSNVAVPKHVLDKVGHFPVGEKVGEDRDLWVRIVLHYPIAYDTRILAVYNLQQGARTCREAFTRPAYPPAIHTLRRLIASNELSPSATARARTLADFHTLEYLYSLVEAGFEADVRHAFREEAFFRVRYRLEARILRLAVAVLPLNLIAVLKHRYRALPTVFDRRKVVSGKVLTHRRITLSPPA